MRAFAFLALSASDRDAVVAAALSHGVGEILNDAIGECGAAEKLALGCRALRMGQKRILAELEAAAGVLSAEAITAVALKGPLLSARLYGDPLLRPSSDVDLMISPADLDRAEAAFARAGYGIERDEARYYRRYHHHLHLKKMGCAPLELHFRAFVGFGATMESDPLIARSLPHGWAVAPWVRILEPEDELLYLAVHAANHGLGRLGWLYDLKLLVSTHPHLQWDVVLERARSLHLVRPFGEAMGALSSRLGVRLPEEVVSPSFAARLWRDLETRIDLDVRLPRPLSEARMVSDAASGIAFLKHNFGRVLFRSWMRLFATR